MLRPTLFALTLLAPLAGAGTALADAYETVKVNAGEELFKADCKRCHSVEADHASYGPLLNGVVGRRAGAVDGYTYSEALAGSGIVWTEPALRAWMEDNTGFMPGTKMRHVGISDRTVQEFIIAYLRSLTAE